LCLAFVGHTRSFLRLNYSADLILLEVAFISGHPRETRLGLLKALNDGVVSAARMSPDDLFILFHEIRGRTFRSAAVWLNGRGIPDTESPAKYTES
jgi:hypothetical protein